MFRVLMDFVDANLTVIVAVVLGMAAMGVLWLAKHPEDWYSWEELDPDIYDESFTDEYEA